MRPFQGQKIPKAEFKIRKAIAISSGIEKIMVTRPESGALKKICSRRVSKAGISNLRKHQTN